MYVHVCEPMCVQTIGHPSIHPSLSTYLFSYMCGWMSVHHVEVGFHRGQMRASDPLKLKFQEVLNCSVWVLGTDLGSSTKTSVLHC